MHDPAISLARGTWLQGESFAYPSGGQTRKGRAVFPDGTVRAVRAGIADTYFSIPAHGRIAGRYVAGYLTTATASGLSTPTDDDPAYWEFRPYDRYAAVVATARPTMHYHVHSSLGSGYLCECDAHYPYDARSRDAALRAERDAWRDYAAEGPDGGASIRITGSVRAGWFDIDDIASLGWSRVVRSWSCTDPACYADAED